MNLNPGVVAITIAAVVLALLITAAISAGHEHKKEDR